MNFDYSRWEKQAAVAAEPHLRLVPDIRSKLSDFDSHLLQAIAQAAIEELDEREEPDLEDSDEDHCLAGDDGCGRFMGGQLGGVHWGSHHEAGAEVLKKPEYGIDQSTGPIRPAPSWLAQGQAH